MLKFNDEKFEFLYKNLFIQPHQKISFFKLYKCLISIEIAIF